MQLDHIYNHESGYRYEFHKDDTDLYTILVYDHERIRSMSYAPSLYWSQRKLLRMIEELQQQD